VHELWDAKDSLSVNPVWVPSERMPFHNECFHLWVLATLDNLSTQVREIETALKNDNKKKTKDLNGDPILDEYNGL